MSLYAARELLGDLRTRRLFRDELEINRKGLAEMLCAARCVARIEQSGADPPVAAGQIAASLHVKWTVAATSASRIRSAFR